MIKRFVEQQEDSPLGTAARARSRRYRLAFVALAFLFCVSTSVDAEPRNRIGKRKTRFLRPEFSESLQDASSAQDSAIYNFNLRGTVDRILSDSADTDLYDPLTVRNLKRLKEYAAPVWGPDDIDPSRNRRVSEKVLAMQTGKAVNSLLGRSELWDDYAAFKRVVRSAQRFFHYSVQHTADSVELTKKETDSPLVDLSVQFNLSQGVDPQIRFGENVRLRYNYVEKQPFLEYGLDF